MARPKSTDKRSAILAAAMEVVAEQGDSAPTAKIAKLAGVAEGTLFTYFSNKEELFNALYLELKAELNAVLMKGFPAEANVKVRLHHLWNKYLDWGTAKPLKRKAMALLGVSEKVGAETKREGAKPFGEVEKTIKESLDQGALRDLPADFVNALLGSIAETTMNFMAASKAEAATYREAGFDAFWKAIAWE
jgi:AcrR family transcriptional regulator